MIVFHGLWRFPCHRAIWARPLYSLNPLWPPQTHCIWNLYPQHHFSTSNSLIQTSKSTASATPSHSSTSLSLLSSTQSPASDTQVPSASPSFPRAYPASHGSCSRAASLGPTAPSWRWSLRHLMMWRYSTDYQLMDALDAVTTLHGYLRSTPECSGEISTAEGVSRNMEPR